MSRRRQRRRNSRRPLPVFEFDGVRVVDNGIEYGHMLRITCRVEGAEQGFILLDDYRDVILLRDTLTRFINRFRLD